jgi:hypothetical protein
MQSSSAGGSRGQWEDYVEQARVKLPEPPPNVMDIYTRWIPWIAIIFGALGLFLIVVFGVIGTLFSMLLMFAGPEGLFAGMGLILSIVLGGAGCVLSIVGGLKMKQMSATGWWIYGISLAVGALTSLVTFNPLVLIPTLAIIWIHIHVRPRYL